MKIGVSMYSYARSLSDGTLTMPQAIKAAKAAGYVTVITADHGNLEEMTLPSGKPHLAHTANPVPFFIIDPAAPALLALSGGSLGDVAPTILNILGLEAPSSMTGKSLADKNHNFGKGRRALLIILDGWGIGPNEADDPIVLAETPVWDALVSAYPPSRLDASGEAVGLQPGKPGNSEAGHINLGAGRVVKQDDVRLDEAMKDGSFEKNEVLLKAIETARERGASLHLLFLLTKASSHGSVDYPLAILKMARTLPEIYLHVIFDGRSTPPGSGPDLLEELDLNIQKTGATCQIVDGVGRGLALDRDHNYVKTKKVFDALVLGEGRKY
jgi:2,3-bisphosphoglycerate-independent phosphoglycerate mutase